MPRPDRAPGDPPGGANAPHSREFLAAASPAPNDGPEAALSREAVDLLPHAPPARLVTAARVDPEGRSCEGWRETGRSDPAANTGGFFPSSLLVELMAQTAGLILPAGSRRAYVAGIRDMRLLDAARAGETVHVRATLHRTMGALFMFDCRADASGKLLARGSITLRAF